MEIIQIKINRSLITLLWGTQDGNPQFLPNTISFYIQHGRKHDFLQGSKIEKTENIYFDWKIVNQMVWWAKFKALLLPKTKKFHNIAAK